MASVGTGTGSRRRPGRELALVLLLAAAGAGLVLLATRQGWARVVTAVPRPLPASVTTVPGHALVPAVTALALAALASLAAILATRRALRRITGGLLAAFGVWIAAVVSAGFSAADVRAAAAGAARASPGSGGTAGSVTAGASTHGSGGAVAPLSGLHSHVVFSGIAWRGVAIAGALAIIAAGVLVVLRANRWPAMSSRYELPRSAGAARGAAGTAAPHGTGGQAGDAATIWESLSRGEDPTSAAPGPGQQHTLHQDHQG